MAPLWKIHLYQKYNYCCCKCRKTVDLTLHHIFGQSDFPEFKTLLANQIVLCSECHASYHNVFLKRKIENCNPITLLQWLGEDFVKNGYKQKPKYLVRIDKRYKENYNRIFKDEGEVVMEERTFQQAFLYVNGKLIKLQHYFVNENGEIFKEAHLDSKGAMIPAKFLIPTKNEKGYYRVKINLQDGKQHQYAVHRIVASTFIFNPDPKILNEVNHLDFNKENNTIGNLEWTDRKGNIEHFWKSPNLQRYENRKLTDDEVRYIRTHYKPYSKEYSYRALGKKFGLDGKCIEHIVKKHTYKDVE